MPNRVDAEDVLQEVSKMLWEKFDEANLPAAFVAWACRTAYYRIMAFRRGQRRQRAVYGDAMLERSPFAGQDCRFSVETLGSASHFSTFVSES